MAAVRPRSMAWCRKTELSTWRAAGFSPKEMLESPSRIWHSGKRSRRRSMASSVWMPWRRSSSEPVQMVKVSGSKMRSCAGSPWRSTASS